MLRFLLLLEVTSKIPLCIPSSAFLALSSSYIPVCDRRGRLAAHQWVMEKLRPLLTCLKLNPINADVFIGCTKLNYATEVFH